MGKYKYRKTTRKNPARPRTMFKKGHKKVGGRVKGTPNKFTGVLKDLILQASANAHKDGTEGYLTRIAKFEPRAFVSLLGRLLPTKIGNEDDEPFKIEAINAAQAGLSKLNDKQLKALEEILTTMGLKT